MQAVCGCTAVSPRSVPWDYWLNFKLLNLIYFYFSFSLFFYSLESFYGAASTVHTDEYRHCLLPTLRVNLNIIRCSCENNRDQEEKEDDEAYKFNQSKLKFLFLVKWNLDLYLTISFMRFRWIWKYGRFI